MDRDINTSASVILPCETASDACRGPPTPLPLPLPLRVVEISAAATASACGETKIIEQEDEVRTCADSRFCHSVYLGARVVCEEGFRIQGWCNCVVAAGTAASSPAVTGILRLLCSDAVH